MGRFLRPCAFCGVRGPCREDCLCAKCVDPEDYAAWKAANPDDYNAWLESQEDDRDDPEDEWGG